MNVDLEPVLVLFGPAPVRPERQEAVELLTTVATECGDLSKSILEELIEIVEPQAGSRTVADVRIGLGYTAVLLDSGACGLAYSFRSEAGVTCSLLQEAGTLVGRPASELIRWLLKPNVLQSAVGLATVNALVEPPGSHLVHGDLAEILDVQPDWTVGMVGYFGPVIAKLRERVARVLVFERRVTEEPDVYPDWAAFELLPTCQAVVISATTLINHTFDLLVQAASSARVIAVLGPSAPLVSEPFRRRNVTHVSGVVVRDAGRVLEIVSQAGGTRNFKDAVERVNLVLDRA